MRRNLKLGIALGAVLALAISSSAAGAASAADRRPKPVRFVSDAGDVVTPSGVSAEATGRVSAPYVGTGAVAQAPTSEPAPPTASPREGGAAESVIGSDRRTQVTDTTSYPARATVLILFRRVRGGPLYQCTGFFISKNTLATAGHCVHSGTGGAEGWYPRSTYTLFPGRNGATIPYKCPGSVTPVASKLWTNSSYTTGGGETHDYGAIRLSCDLGSTVGWYGYLNTQNNSQVGVTVVTRGYPGDKASGTQWLADNCASFVGSFACTVGAAGTRQLFYKNDTFGGQSGSPVYRTYSGNCCYAVAIHTQGLHGSSPHSTNNHGSRIESNLASFLNDVKNRT